MSSPKGPSKPTLGRMETYSLLPASRVIEAIQVTLNKYAKRERKKTLPEGADRWIFQCRVGASPETALPCQLAEIPAGIAAVASAEHPGVYVEILAEPRLKTAGTEGTEKSEV